MNASSNQRISSSARVYSPSRASDRRSSILKGPIFQYLCLCLAEFIMKLNPAIKSVNINTIKETCFILKN